MREVTPLQYYVPFLGFRTVEDEEAQDMGLSVGNWSWRVFEFSWTSYGLVLVAWPRDKS